MKSSAATVYIKILNQAYCVRHITQSHSHIPVTLKKTSPHAPIPRPTPIIKSLEFENGPYIPTNDMRPANKLAKVVLFSCILLF